MIECPKCGELNGNDRSRCFKCGSDLHGRVGQTYSSVSSGPRANRICPNCKKVFYGVTYTECPNCHVPMALYSLEAKLAAEGKNQNYRPQQVPPTPQDSKKEEPVKRKTSFELMSEQLGLDSYDSGTVELFKMVDMFFPYHQANGSLFTPELFDVKDNVETITNIQASSYWFNMIQIRQNQIIIELLQKIVGEKEGASAQEDDQDADL